MDAYFVSFCLFLQGTVVLVFQPAEEGGGGAKKMIEAGTLENVDAIFGLHVAPNLPIGEVASRPGPMLAGSGFFEAVISGKGGHAAIPQHSIDPILAASNVIVSLQHLVSREADPLDSQVSLRLFHRPQDLILYNLLILSHLGVHSHLDMCLTLRRFFGLLVHFLLSIWCLRWVSISCRNDDEILRMII